MGRRDATRASASTTAGRARPSTGAHYLRNRRRYIERSHRRKRQLWAERTQLLIDYFAEHPCVDCGEADPVVLEFDHLRDKRFSIGPKLATHSWEDILEEIAKCDVVCANCHRRRTARRRGSNRARLTGLDVSGTAGPPWGSS